MAKISVIMGIYNCASTLQEALDSLYSQTFQDFEIILCDDGSKDNTYEVALQNKRQHENIILLRNEQNLGLNATLNKCLTIAKGDYIARMDGDDISLPTRFEKQVKFLDEHPEFALVSCPMSLFDKNGEWGKNHLKAYPSKKDVITHIPSFTHAAVMIRKSVYVEVGGYTQSEYLLRVEDCHLWFKIYSLGYIGANLQEVLYCMRDDRDATSRRNWLARRNGIYVTWCGYRMFNMPWYWYPKLIIHASVEIAKYLMPQFVYEYFHHRR